MIRRLLAVPLALLAMLLCLIILDAAPAAAEGGDPTISAEGYTPAAPTIPQSAAAAVLLRLDVLPDSAEMTSPDLATLAPTGHQLVERVMERSRWSYLDPPPRLDRTRHDAGIRLHGAHAVRTQASVRHRLT